MPTDHKTILFHLIDKIKRTGDYYRRIAMVTRKRADRDPAPELDAKAAELDRCAKDCDYSVAKATERFNASDHAELNAFFASRPAG